MAMKINVNHSHRRRPGRSNRSVRCIAAEGRGGVAKAWATVVECRATVASAAALLERSARISAVAAWAGCLQLCEERGRCGRSFLTPTA